MAVSEVVRFWLLPIFILPSIICCCLGLYCFLFNRALRRAHHNHVIIVILFLCLFFELNDLLRLVYHYGTGHLLSSAMTFCLVWQYINYTGFLEILLLVAWASVERHILIFNDRWLRARKSRFLIHYLPLILLMLYPALFYIYIFLIFPCEHRFNFLESQCRRNICALHNKIISIIDSVVHNILPTLTIIICSIILLIRVLYQKRRLNQRIHWRNYRKMTIQMFSVSSLFFFVYLTPMVLYVAYSFGLSRSVAYSYYEISAYLNNFIIILIPFTSIIPLPELRTKLKTAIQKCQQQFRHIDIRQKWMDIQRIVRRPVVVTPINE